MADEKTGEKRIDKKQEKKPSKAAKIGKGIVTFFKDIRNELKKVIWLTRKQLINNTITVIVACILLAILIALVDLGMSLIFEYIFKRGIG